MAISTNDRVKKYLLVQDLLKEAKKRRLDDYATKRFVVKGAFNSGKTAEYDKWLIHNDKHPYDRPFNKSIATSWNKAKERMAEYERDDNGEVMVPSLAPVAWMNDLPDIDKDICLMLQYLRVPTRSRDDDARIEEVEDMGIPMDSTAARARFEQENADMAARNWSGPCDRYRPQRSFYNAFKRSCGIAIPAEDEEYPVIVECTQMYYDPERLPLHVRQLVFAKCEQDIDCCTEDAPSPEEIDDIVAKAQKRHYAHWKAQKIEEGGCETCGSCDYRIMEAHHKDPSLKTGNPSLLGADAFDEEEERCGFECQCKRCHRSITFSIDEEDEESDPDISRRKKYHRVVFGAIKLTADFKRCQRCGLEVEVRTTKLNDLHHPFDEHGFASPIAGSSLHQFIVHPKVANISEMAQRCKSSLDLLTSGFDEIDKTTMLDCNCHKIVTDYQVRPGDKFELKFVRIKGQRRRVVAYVATEGTVIPSSFDPANPPSSVTSRWLRLEDRPAATEPLALPDGSNGNNCVLAEVFCADTIIGGRPCAVEQPRCGRLSCCSIFGANGLQHDSCLDCAKDHFSVCLRTEDMDSDQQLAIDMWCRGERIRVSINEATRRNRSAKLTNIDTESVPAVAVAAIPGAVMTGQRITRSSRRSLLEMSDVNVKVTLTGGESESSDATGDESAVLSNITNSPFGNKTARKRKTKSAKTAVRKSTRNNRYRGSMADEENCVAVKQSGAKKSSGGSKQSGAKKSSTKSVPDDESEYSYMSVESDSDSDESFLCKESLDLF